MRLFGKFGQFFKDPPLWFLLPLYAASVAACFGVLWLTSLGTPAFPLSVAVYAFYALAGVLFVYSFYTFVKLIVRLVKKLDGVLRRRGISLFSREQYGLRGLLFFAVSFGISIVNALFNGMLGILFHSVWYGALAAYYLALALLRGGILFFPTGGKIFSLRREGGEAEEAAGRAEEKRGLRIYGGCGAALLVLSVCFSVAVALTVRGEGSFEHAGLAIYAAALYTFYKVTVSIVNFFKTRKMTDMRLHAVRTVNIADALVSLFALQTAMFREFSPEADMGPANALTGLAVCALTAAMGIVMFVGAALRLKKIKREGDTDD